jgi:ATP-dependent protease HslVU (ClpYQ) peptidase subunit
MTCIVGIREGGRVYIGADSAGLADMDLVIRKDKKVFVNDGFAIGFTTSFRMGQLLAYAFKPPQMKPNADIMRFMATDFVNAVRECFKSGGWAQRNSDAESGGNFLVGYKGRLFHVCSDYQVGEVAAGFDAVGCGAEAAIGALYAMPKMEPRKALLTALSVAEKCSGGVRAPFNIVRI